MLRFARIAMTGLFASALAGAASPPPAPPSDSTVPPFLTRPWLQNVSDTAITVLWESSLPTPGSVAFGRGNVLDRSVPSASEPVFRGHFVHKARLSHLHPGTRHTYRATMGTTSIEGAFSTAPPPGTGSIRFGIWGDSHRQHPALEMFRFMIDSLHVDFAATTGDISNNGYDSADLAATFIPTTLGGIGCRVPFFIATGNHDVVAGPDPVSALRRYLDLPKDANSDPAGISGSYVAIYGPVAMIFLDDARIFTDIPSWLDRQLQSETVRSAPLVLTFLHRPPFLERWVAGETPHIKTWYPPLLAAHHVAASFSGHMHGYERGFFRGTFYVTAGGGSYLDTDEPATKNYSFIAPGAFGSPSTNDGLLNHFLTVDAASDLAVIRMHAFDANGSYLGVRDSFSIPRSVGAPRSNGIREARAVVRDGFLEIVPVAGSAPTGLELVGIDGRTIRRPGSPDARIALAGIATGLYIARWRNGDQPCSQTILVTGDGRHE